MGALGLQQSGGRFRAPFQLAELQEGDPIPSRVIRLKALGGIEGSQSQWIYPFRRATSFSGAHWTSNCRLVSEGTSSKWRGYHVKGQALASGDSDKGVDAGSKVVIEDRRDRDTGGGGSGDVEIEDLSFVAEGRTRTGAGSDWREENASSNAWGPNSGLRDERFLRRVAAAENSDTVLAMINEREPKDGGGGVLSNSECSDLILAAIAQNNVDLAFSILNAMRSSLLQRRIDRPEAAAGSREESQEWTWPQADVSTHVALVRGLAASLRVSDAIATVGDVRRRGIPPGDEVPFGKVVSCPICKTSLAVVQPQHGVQLVPCASCRYQYELMSGVIVSSESESISTDDSVVEKVLKLLPFLKRRVPAAVHSVVVRAPDGLARTHRFATSSADVPAQEGERVTVALACPANAGRGFGPVRFNFRTPGWQPSEPMAVTNHATGRVADLIRAPPKAGTGTIFDTSVVVPLAVLLASTDAASGLIDPTLPRLITASATAAIVLGGAANTFVLPRLNQLPQRTVDATALRQKLLAQYEQLQARLQELTQATADEVRMLARMCQLQNKMEAVGETSYSARIERVRKARIGLDERLAARLELIDSYAKVASMIEIEVEMDIDVLVAETAKTDAAIAEQIERLMEVDSLQKEWRNQAEANDEVERLLRSAPLLPDSL
ncbi:hypothetical protein R1sor_018511 [Riccia sorocarpa]|uniref:Uncharacterized protein n=1 Tax=Riccia sorocarpa TaxID=122646 RepID=A0ABD3IG49_9MARC